MKKILAFLISAFLIISLAGCSEEATVNGITWTYELINGEAANVKPKDKLVHERSYTRDELASFNTNIDEILKNLKN